MLEKENLSAVEKEKASAERALDEIEKEALKKLKRLEEDYISPDSGISSGLALPPAKYVYMAGIFVLLFLLLYLLASSLESGMKNSTPSSEKTPLQKMETPLKK